MRFDEGAGLEFMANDNIAADGNPLSGYRGVDRMDFFTETQVAGSVDA